VLKTVLGACAGLIAWVLLVTICGLILRASWPEYAAVAAAMTFTLPMLIARLVISAVTLVAASALAALIASGAESATVLLGVVLLVGFVPVHVGLWHRFPVWYHLTFLLTLIPLSMLGGRLARRPRIR